MLTRQCRSCGADVLWATVETSSKIMPIHKDSLHDPRGNLEVWKDESGKVRCRYLKGDEPLMVPLPGHFRAMSHYAFCPDAEAWRAKNRK